MNPFCQSATGGKNPNDLVKFPPQGGTRTGGVRVRLLEIGLLAEFGWNMVFFTFESCAMLAARPDEKAHQIIYILPTSLERLDHVCK